MMTYLPWTGSVLKASSNTLVMSDGLHEWNYTGSSFGYDSNGRLVSGTVTGYSGSVGGSPQWKVTGLSVPASSVDTSSPIFFSSLGDYAFAGNDRFYSDSVFYTALPYTVQSLSGYAGDDLFYLSGALSVSFVDGGAGTDTAIYAGNRSAYNIPFLGLPVDGLVQKKSASLGIIEGDHLHSIERLQFADTAIALDTNGGAGKAYRLYQSAFDRTPDKAGLGYWINILDKGTSVYDVAGYFMDSAEFKAMYGANPTNMNMVTQFYQHVLHRAPDQSGLNYWVNLLDTHAVSAKAVLSEISESAENQALVVGAIQNGIEFTPFG